MKYSILLVVLLTTPATGPFARADFPENVDEVTKAMIAEIQVTHDNVANLQSQLGALEGNPYDDASYKPLAEDFKKRVSAALAQFDDTVTRVIMPEAQYWLNRHAALAKSVGGSQDLTANTQAQMTIVSKEYQAAILEVYRTVVGDIPLYAQVTGKKIANAGGEYCGKPDKSFEKAARSKKTSHDAVVLSFLLTGWNSSRELPTGYCVAVYGKDFVQVHDQGYYGNYLFRNGTFQSGSSTKPGASAWLVDQLATFADSAFPSDRPPALESLHKIFGGSILDRMNYFNYDVSPWGGLGLDERPRVELPDGLKPSVILESEILKGLTEGCETSKCRQLRLADTIQFITLADATIKKNISFHKLGIPVYLTAPTLETEALEEAIRDLSVKL